MSDLFKFVQGQDYFLAGSGCTATATSITLKSFKLPDNETELTMTDFGSVGYGVLEPGTSKEENISFTGITAGSGDLVTLTGVTRGLKFNDDYSADSNLRQAHGGGAKFLISNTPQFYAGLSGKNNDESVNGIWTFDYQHAPRASQSITYGAGTELYFVTYEQLAATSFTGTVNASTTQKGVNEIATTAEAAAGTGTGGTGAVLVIGASMCNATSSAAVLIPVTNSSGKLSSGFGGAASSLATLDSSSKVVENPANATATPTSSKIPISSASTVLDVGWIDTGTTANKIVKLDGSAKLPAVDGSQLTNVAAASYKTVTATRVGDTASGTQVITHNLGRVPVIVDISASIGDTGSASFGRSNGSYDGTTNACEYLAKKSADSLYQSGVSANIVDLPMYDGTAKQQATVTAMSTTTVTLTWVRTGASDSDTINMKIKVN